MTKLTEKQEKFVIAKLDGLSNTQAAISAGYPASSAAVQANKLLKTPKVIAALGENGLDASPNRGDDATEDENSKYGLRTDYKSSLDMLQHVYNNPKMSMSARMQAAIQALPYEHAKIGEKGKKEKRAEEAEKQAGEGKFQTGRPPRGRPALRAVPNGG